MFSVIIAAPSATALSAITIGCRSVGEARVGQRHDVDRASAGGPSRPGSRRRCPAPTAPAVRQLVQRDLEVLRAARCAPCTSPRVIAAANAQVPATMRSGTTSCARSARSRSTPSIVSVDVPTPSIFAPISLQHLRRGRRSPARGPRCRSPWCPRRAPRPSAGSRWRRRSGSPARSVAPVQAAGRPGDDEAVLAVELGAQLGQAGRCACRAAREPIASPPGMRDLGLAAAGDAAARARRSRRACGAPGRSRPGARARPGRRSTTVATSGVVVDRAAEPAQQLGHDLDVEDVGAPR